MIIYKIINIINNKIYIGQTIGSLKKRWDNHCNGNDNCTLLKRAIKKYGKENFTIEIFDTSETLKELNQKEIYWIKELNSLAPNGYNTDLGGKNSLRTEEVKRKCSETQKGKHHSLKTEFTSENTKGDKNPFYNKKHTEETINIIKEKRKLQITSDKTKKKMSDQRKGILHPRVKITEEIVINIRKLKNQGYSNTKLSQMFNLKTHHIFDIVNRRSWKHI